MIIDLKKHKSRESDENRQDVLDTLMELNSASIGEIIRHICSKKEEAKRKVEEGAQKIFEDGLLNRSEMKRYIEKEAPKPAARRTYHRKIKELLKDGLVIKKHRRYSISEKVKSDMRFFPRDFGESALSHLMTTHYPTINTLNKNLDRLIKIFGSYVVYCFIEASRPVVDYSKRHSMTNIEKDKLASEWIQKVFSPLNMYNYFLAVIENQPSDEAVQKTLNNNFKKVEKGRSENVDEVSNNKRGPQSTQDFAMERFVSLSSNFNHAHYIKGKPLYELDEETIKRLTRSFKEMYPIIYEQLLEARANFLGKPKQQSLPENKKQNMPQYFDYDED